MPESNNTVNRILSVLQDDGIINESYQLLPLHRGHSQQNFQLISSSPLHPSFFVKYFSCKASFEHTLTVYKQLRSTKLTLPITKAFHHELLLIQPWCAASALDEVILEKSSRIELLGNALEEIHTHSVPLETLQLNELLKPAHEQLQVSEFSDRICAYDIRAISSALLTLQKGSLCLCHLDLSFGNLLAVNNISSTQALKTQVIDWEYAAITHPIIDIANAVTINQLTVDQTQHLLSHYQKRRDIELSFFSIALDFSVLISSAWYLQKYLSNKQEKWRQEAKRLLDWREEFKATKLKV